jgi:hypothetical protein
LNLTVSLAATPAASTPQLLAVVHEPFSNWTYRYSILAVQLSVNAASMPAPATQPGSVDVLKLPAMTLGSMLPNAPQRYRRLRPVLDRSLKGACCRERRFGPEMRSGSTAACIAVGIAVPGPLAIAP